MTTVALGERRGEAGEDVIHLRRTDERSKFGFFTTVQAAARRKPGLGPSGRFLKDMTCITR